MKDEDSRWKGLRHRRLIKYMVRCGGPLKLSNRWGLTEAEVGRRASHKNSRQARYPKLQARFGRPPFEDEPNVIQQRLIGAAVVANRKQRRKAVGVVIRRIGSVADSLCRHGA